MHRTTLGNFELTAISDGTYSSMAALSSASSPSPCGKKGYCPRSEPHSFWPNSYCRPHRRQNILIETGIGNKLPTSMVQIYRPARQTARQPRTLRQISLRRHRHRHQRASPLRPLRWDTFRVGDRSCPHFPGRSITRPKKEWEHGKACNSSATPSATSAPITIRLLQAARWDSERRSGNCTRSHGGSFPGHTPHMQTVTIGSDTGQWENGLLYLRPNPDHLASRTDLGDGVQPVSANHHRQP